LIALLQHGQSKWLHAETIIIIEIDSKPKRRHQRHNNRLQVDYQWSKARAILTIIAEVSEKATININSGNKTMEAQFSTHKPAPFIVDTE